MREVFEDILLLRRDSHPGGIRLLVIRSPSVGSERSISGSCGKALDFRAPSRLLRPSSWTSLGKVPYTKVVKRVAASAGPRCIPIGGRFSPHLIFISQLGRCDCGWCWSTLLGVLRRVRLRLPRLSSAPGRPCEWRTCPLLLQVFCHFGPSGPSLKGASGRGHVSLPLRPQSLALGGFPFAT